MSHLMRAPYHGQPEILQASATCNIGVPVDKSSVEIREVWANNLHDEMHKIIELVDTYNYIAMDTEFPGVVVRPTQISRNNYEHNYLMMKSNCDHMKMIQLGICLCDQQGNYIPNLCCWQFNFKFVESCHLHSTDSIELLKKSGIDFAALEMNGIEWQEFAELLITSGIVLNRNVNWISFHSGFDFAYLLRVITNHELPATDEEFFSLLSIYCPIIYDIKYIMKSCEHLRGGLQKIAEALDVHRIGPQHQAGSDALLTAAAFFKMREDYFDSVFDDNKYQNVIFGLSCPQFGKSPQPCIEAKQAANEVLGGGSNINHDNHHDDGNENNNTVIVNNTSNFTNPHTRQQSYRDRSTSQNHQFSNNTSNTAGGSSRGFRGANSGRN